MSGTSGNKQYQSDQSNVLPLVVGGYSDGTVRLFNITKVEMLLKMQPHAVTVTAIVFSADGESGSENLQWSYGFIL